MKQEKKTDKSGLLSFVGGVLVTSVVLGIIVAKNEQVRQEIEELIQAVVKSGRETIVQYQGVVSGINDIRALIQNDKETSKIRPKTLPADAYERQWQQVLAKVQG